MPRSKRCIKKYPNENRGEALRVDFHCRVIFTCVRTYVKSTFANKIGAMHERSLVSVRVEPRSTSRLSSALFSLPLFYLRDKN